MHNHVIQLVCHTFSFIYSGSHLTQLMVFYPDGVVGITVLMYAVPVGETEQEYVLRRSMEDSRVTMRI